MKKKLLAVGTAGAVMALTTVNAFASSGVDISTAMTTGLAEIQTQAFSAIGAVAPIAVAIVGAIIGVKIAIRALRSVVG